MSGITSYRGFLYQQEVFYKILLEKLNSNCTEICFEIADDVSVEKLVDCKISNELIQVKTGQINAEDCYKIFENWIISTDINKFENFQYMLFSEKAISVIIDDNFKDELKKHVLSAQQSDIRTVRRKAYEKIKTLKPEELDAVLSHIKKSYKTKESVQLVEIKNEQFELFNKEYCVDIDKELTAPRKERFEYVKTKIFNDLVEEVENGNGYKINYETFKKYWIESCQRFGNDIYNPEYSVFKSNPSTKAVMESSLSENRLEIKQLKLAGRTDDQIYEDILRELFYRQLLPYYAEKNNNLILTTHEEAKDNYNKALEELEFEGKPLLPKNVYFMTTRKDIKSEIISKTGGSSFLQKGCYIHMTSLDVDDSLRIKWGDLPDEN